MPQHPEGHVFYRRMWHDYPRITHGKGATLYAADGREFLDATGGAMVVNIGHGVDEIADAVAEQIRQVGYVHAVKFTTPVMEAYANALAEVIPLPEARFFPLTSGSEAVEAAIKLARHIQVARGIPTKNRIISRWHAYHGITLSTLALGSRKTARAHYQSMFKDAIHIDSPNAYHRRPGESLEACGERAARALEQAINRYGAQHIAAFIAEPLPGTGLGAPLPPPNYWPRIREICNRYSILLIADEVMCGFGRTGKWAAYEHFGFTPDIVCFGKGVAGGTFPLSLMAVRGNLLNALYDEKQDFAHGGTFSHHPVGAAAGLATLRYMQKHDLVNETVRKGEILGTALHRALDNLPGVGDVRGLGLMWGIEFVADKETHRPFDYRLKIAQRINSTAMERGLMVYPGTGSYDGTSGDIILLGPPMITTEDELQRIVDLLAETITTVMENLPEKAKA